MKIVLRDSRFIYWPFFYTTTTTTTTTTAPILVKELHRFNMGKN